MTNPERIAAIRAEFPKHRKEVYSIATRTDETGAMLCRRARELAGLCKPPANRKNAARLTVRITPEEREQLTRRMTALGYDSLQDYLAYIIRRELKGD